MNNPFDDLFDAFFRELFNKYSSNSEIRDYLKMITEGKAIPLDDGAYTDFNIDEDNPDEVTYEEKNGLYIKTQIWHTSFGDITHKTFRDLPFDDVVVPKKPKEAPTLDKHQLELMLTKAIAEENYEEAARVRDLLNPPAPKKVRKPRAKKKTDTE